MTKMSLMPCGLRERRPVALWQHPKGECCCHLNLPKKNHVKMWNKNKRKTIVNNIRAEKSAKQNIPK